MPTQWEKELGLEEGRRMAERHPLEPMGYSWGTRNFLMGYKKVGVNFSYLHNDGKVAFLLGDVDSDAYVGSLDMDDSLAVVNAAKERDYRTVNAIIAQELREIRESPRALHTDPDGRSYHHHGKYKVANSLADLALVRGLSVTDNFHEGFHPTERIRKTPHLELLREAVDQYKTHGTADDVPPAVIAAGPRPGTIRSSRRGRGNIRY